MGLGEVVRRVGDVAEAAGEVFVNAGHGVDVWVWHVAILGWI
jgi:hypothetical protein